MVRPMSFRIKIRSTLRVQLIADGPHLNSTTEYAALVADNDVIGRRAMIVEALGILLACTPGEMEFAKGVLADKMETARG